MKKGKMILIVLCILSLALAYYGFKYAEPFPKIGEEQNNVK